MDRRLSPPRVDYEKVQIFHKVRKNLNSTFENWRQKRHLNIRERLNNLENRMELLKEKQIQTFYGERIYRLQLHSLHSELALDIRASIFLGELLEADLKK